MYDNVVLPSWLHHISPLLYGCEACSPGHNYGPAARKYYLLHYILSGKGKFFKGGTVHDVCKGDVFVICPGEITTYTADTSDPWSYVWIGFSCDLELPFLKQTVLRGLPLGVVFEKISDYAIRGGCDVEVFSALYELLGIISAFEKSSYTQVANYAQYLKMYIDHAYMQRISIQDTADRLHINRRYLTTLFRTEYGIPPSAYLMNLRLKNAKVFLQRGISVSDVASMTGFSDLSNFSKLYKAKFGHPPREEHRKLLPNR